MSKEALEKDSDFQPILDRTENKPNKTPTGLYNGMLNPIIPYTIKGVIWYQGESNAARAHQYRKLFPAMIENWRNDFGQGDFPFYYVQIAPYKYGNPDRTKAAELQEAQLMTLSQPNTGMAVTLDIGNNKDIHPKNKFDVANRLALWALAKNYGHEDIVYSGPLYKDMKIEDDKIRVYFDHTAEGLTVKGGTLRHFEIAGEDKKFIPANAKIDSDTVIVWSDEVKNPVAVRYAFKNAPQPEANLYNSASLPASLFRTDDWKAETYGRK
jgi:sialate O-acetylesterase